MKKYKDGKMVEMTPEEVEKIRNRMNRRRANMRPMAADYEARIKSLEDQVETLTAQLNKEKATEEA